MQGFERNVTLIWGNKAHEDITVKEEIEVMEHSFEIMHVTSEEPTWQGERGFIDEQLLRKHGPDFARPEFVVSGPPS